MAFWFSALLVLRTIAAVDAAQDLIRLEQQLTDALANYDTRTVERLWADDLVFVGTTGKASSKSERLSGMKPSSSSTITAVTNDEVKVRVYGNTAVVTLRSTWTTQANTREIRDQYMTTHVWIKRNGRWQLVSAQVSRATP